ncbi:MAG: hypothetical protein ACE5Q6_20570, partial [Dehalococcoidia bacterium]
SQRDGNRRSKGRIEEREEMGAGVIGLVMPPITPKCGEVGNPRRRVTTLQESWIDHEVPDSGQRP